MSLFKQKCPLCRYVVIDDSPLAVADELKSHFEANHQQGPAIVWDDVRPEEGEA